jgi:hypothetical protein
MRARRRLRGALAAVAAAWAACAPSGCAGISPPERALAGRSRVAAGIASHWQRTPFRPTLTLRGGAGVHRQDSDLSLDHSGTASLDLSLLETRSAGSALGDSVSEGDGTREFRAQVVRLMVQAMDEYGFPESARSLERESGVLLHDDTALEALGLQASIRDGDWARVEGILDAASWADNRMRFDSYRQLYLELVQAGDLEQAAQCLESKVTPCALTLPAAYRKEVGILRTHLYSAPAKVHATRPADSISSRRGVLAVSIAPRVG